MNGTSHLTVSPAPTGSTPAPRASPVARRLRLGDDVSAFWRLAITRRIVAHLPHPSLPPSAASKLLALFVALHMGLMPVLSFGSAALRELLVGPCTRGEAVICMGIAEPQAGIDVARVQTAAGTPRPADWPTRGRARRRGRTARR